MTITIAPDRSARVADLARRIVKHLGDDELANDFLELLILVSDTNADTPRAAMKSVIANSGLIEAIVDDHCRRIDIDRRASVASGESDAKLPLPSEASRPTA